MKDFVEAFAAMVVYRPYHVDQRAMMLQSPSSSFDDKYSTGLASFVLLAMLLLSWLLGAKNYVMEWANTAEETQTLAPPNILMIVVDDLGYNDTSAINANGIPTPHIAELARQGVTFRRHYADSTCTPSRVAMLTGRHPERSGFRPVGIEIPAEHSTIAQQLSAVGYSTYLTGKWHAGEEQGRAWPQHKGFPQWFGFLNQWELSGEVTLDGKGGLQRPTYRNPMLRRNGGTLEPHEGHLTDILTEHTLAKLKQFQSQGTPWFLYHAFLAPHHPIQPSEHYKSQFPDSPEGEYMALVTQLDDAVGKILNAIEEENTLVIFVSDNGGTNKQRDNNFPFFGKKGDNYEGAFRTPLIVSWPGVTPQGQFIDDTVMNVDLYPTLLAAAHAEIPTDLDGQNLLPLMQKGARLEPRDRGWEVFSANVSALGYSYLSESGQWRLSSLQGLAPSLHKLSEDPSGERDVGAQHPGIIAELSRDFWRDSWRKSALPVRQEWDKDSNQRLYSGFDAMRTPLRYGLTIGLEIGPLPASVTKDAQAQTMILLAGQKDYWKLMYNPQHGLEWHIGDAILRDASFRPSQCNAIVLTNYFEPVAHLAIRAPRSQLKFYSSGFLSDYNTDFDYTSISGGKLETPTFVNFGGHAKFSNMMLSSQSDSYTPVVRPQYFDIYAALQKEGKLSQAEVNLMTDELCQ